MNQALIEFVQLCVRSSRLRVQSNRNCNVYVRQQIRRPVLSDVVRRKVAGQHCQYLLVNRQQQLPCKNLYNTADGANLCCTKENKEIVVIFNSIIEANSIQSTYQTQLFGFGINGSLRNFRKMSVQTSATVVCGNVSMYSASLPEIQPSIIVSLIFENE